MKRQQWFPLIILGLLAWACNSGTPTPRLTPTTSLPITDPAAPSAFDAGKTAHGFFPSPPDARNDTILNHFKDLGDHADFILIQPNIPWEDFVDGVEGSSKGREDIRNQTILAEIHDLEWVFVVDPLNGLDRREFYGLPEGWEASFANPAVRQALTNFSLWIMAEFEPRYLGLASEINTYMDAHPEDVPHYLSLYQEIYDQVKAQFPETQIFVTFQWDDLNNMFPSVSEGRPAYHTNWDQVEMFEPRLDLWAISSYPYFVYQHGEGIPDDYYARLLEATEKPIAVAEGGFTSIRDPQDQVAYLRAVDDQLGDRMVFWVYLILSDLNMEALRPRMVEQGMPEEDIQTLSQFASIGLQTPDGTPKPALEVWDDYLQDDK